MPEEKKLNTIDYVGKFSSRAQDPERAVPPLFKKYYRKNPHELKSDLEFYVNNAINAEIFFEKEGVTNCNLAEYLYSKICELVLKI